MLGTFPVLDRLRSGVTMSVTDSDSSFFEEEEIWRPISTAGVIAL